MSYIHFSTSGLDRPAARGYSDEHEPIRQAILDVSPSWVSDTYGKHAPAKRDPEEDADTSRWIVVTHQMHDRTVFMAYDTRRHWSAQAYDANRLSHQIRQTYTEPHDATSTREAPESCEQSSPRGTTRAETIRAGTIHAGTVPVMTSETSFLPPFAVLDPQSPTHNPRLSKPYTITRLLSSFPAPESTKRNADQAALTSGNSRR